MAPTRAKVRQVQQQKSLVRQADPLTLVSLAKEELYSEVPRQNRGSLHAIEEVITRMEQQTRAISGSTIQFAGAPVGEDGGEFS